MDKSYPVNIGSKDTMELYFKQSHRLKYYELDHIDEYKHKGLLDKEEGYVLYMVFHFQEKRKSRNILLVIMAIKYSI